MTEITPTESHLNDPYVLQLIEALSRMEDEVERLTAERNDANNLLRESRQWITAAYSEERTAFYDKVSEYLESQIWETVKPMLSRIDAAVRKLTAGGDDRGSGDCGHCPNGTQFESEHDCQAPDCLPTTATDRDSSESISEDESDRSPDDQYCWEHGWNPGGKIGGVWFKGSCPVCHPDDE